MDKKAKTSILIFSILFIALAATIVIAAISTELSSPSDSLVTTNRNVIFTCNMSSSSNLANTTLYLGNSTSFKANQTRYYSNTPLNPSNLVGYWKYDNNALDSSGNSLDGVEFGTIDDAAGVVNNAYLFDASDDYVNVADNNLLDITGNITLMAWMKPISSDSSPIVQSGNEWAYLKKNNIKPCNFP
jgi:hypothetical protein